MNIVKKNRTELRSYFVKNSIPTESNFADLIDGMLNQKEDGIFKLSSGDPLSIVATGDPNSQQKLINFYQKLEDADPAWMLKLSPQGFSISDGQGMSRLFIDHNRGNVGIGKTSLDPNFKLDVNDSLRVGSGLFVSGSVGIGTVGGFLARLTIEESSHFMLAFRDTNCAVNEGGLWRMPIANGVLRFDVNTDPDPDHVFRNYLAPLAMTKEGNVGIGTTNPDLNYKLDVNGALKVAGHHITWGNNSVLSVDQGGSIELGGNNSTQGVGTPYIDFHYKDKVEDFNTRIINDADGQLTLVAPVVNVKGHIRIEHWSAPLSFRETDCDVDKGGLWRMPLDGGALRFDVNTGAPGQEFGNNYITALFMTKEGNVIVGAKSSYWGHNPYSDVIGPPVASIGRLEVGGFYDGSDKVPAVLRIHQWGSGSAEFYKPQGQILYLRETPGGNGGWFNTLEVSGAIRAGNSDLYFSNTDHNHTGIGNTAGWAAIENAKDHDALMILGRAGTDKGRKVRLWDYLKVNGVFVNNSDRGLKKDIENLKYGLEELRRLRPVSFNWRTIPNPHRSLGLIAQEVQPVIQEVVYSDDVDIGDSNLSIAYTSFIPILINAIKELDARIDSIAARRLG